MFPGDGNAGRQATATASLDAESRLLLLLVRREVTPEIEARRRRLLRDDIDWPRLVAQARAHDVLPLVARQVRALDAAAVPAPVRAELAAGARMDALRNTLQAAELVDILRLLGVAGIPVVPLKGPPLAQSLYGDISARVCSDLDVLVPRNAVARAYDALIAAGYAPGEIGPLDPGDFPILLDSNIEYPFVRRHGGFTHVLEVHWSVAWRWRRGAQAMADLWADTRPLRFGGTEAVGLSTEWELLYLAVHAARHRWQELKWLADIDAIVATRTVDWDLVRRKAERFGWALPLAFTLRAAHALLETPVPAGFRGHRLPGWFRLLPAEPTGPRISDALFTVRMFPGVRSKLGYLAHLLVVPTLAERRLFRLPRGLDVLYYGLRPARLGGKWAWPLLRAAMRSRGPAARMRARVTP